MVLMEMKYGCMDIGFIQQNIVILPMVKGTHKSHHQTTLHNESLPSLEV